MYVIGAARMGRATSIGLRPLRKDDFGLPDMNQKIYLEARW